MKETLKKHALGFMGLIVFTTLLGYIDYVTGWKFGFFIFYFVPIMISAWTISSKAAYFIVVYSSVSWFVSNELLTDSVGYAYWNTITRFVAFWIMAYLVLRIKKMYDMEIMLKNALEKSMEEIKVLRGLLTVCASCRKVMNEQGNWEQIESYITKHSEAEFTHGMCEECVKKLYPDIYEHIKKKGIFQNKLSFAT